jgi:hypothetical protein
MAKKDIVRIDFSKEEGGGGGNKRYKEGDYRAKIVKIKHGQSSEKHTPGIFVGFKIIDGPDPKAKGNNINDRLWLTPKSLYRIRNLLEAIGLKVPKSMVSIPLTKLIGKEVGITLVDDEYQDKKRSEVADYIDLETLAEADAVDADDEDDDPFDDDDKKSKKNGKKSKKGKKGKKGKKAKAQDDEDLEELDLDEL